MTFTYTTRDNTIKTKKINVNLKKWKFLLKTLTDCIIKEASNLKNL